MAVFAIPGVRHCIPKEVHYSSWCLPRKEGTDTKHFYWDWLEHWFKMELDISSCCPMQSFWASSIMCLDVVRACMWICDWCKIVLIYESRRPLGNICTSGFVMPNEENVFTVAGWSSLGKVSRNLHLKACPGGFILLVGTLTLHFGVPWNRDEPKGSNELSNWAILS